MARKPISTQVRYRVFDRDGHTCQYCGAKAPDVILQVDHIKPVAAGGSDDLANLRTACFSCNQGKSDYVKPEVIEMPKEEPKHPLIGWAFLSMNEGTGTEWQGVIRDVFQSGTAEGDMALVDFFEWFVGDYTHSNLIAIADFAARHNSSGRRWYKLFPSVEERNDYYQNRQVAVDKRLRGMADAQLKAASIRAGGTKEEALSDDF